MPPSPAWSRLRLNHVEVGGEEALHCACDRCILTSIPSFKPALRDTAEQSAVIGNTE